MFSVSRMKVRVGVQNILWSDTKNISVVSNHSPILHPSIHIFLFLSLSLSLSLVYVCSILAPRQLFSKFCDSKTSQTAWRLVCFALYTEVDKKKYVSMACKFLIKEPTRFVMVSVEFVTIAGNTTSAINRISNVFVIELK